MTCKIRSQALLEMSGTSIFSRHSGPRSTAQARHGIQILPPFWQNEFEFTNENSEREPVRICGYLSLEWGRAAGRARLRTYHRKNRAMPTGAPCLACGTNIEQIKPAGTPAHAQSRGGAEGASLDLRVRGLPSRTGCHHRDGARR